MGNKVMNKHTPHQTPQEGDRVHFICLEASSLHPPSSSIPRQPTSSPFLPTDPFVIIFTNSWTDLTSLFFLYFFLGSIFHLGVRSFSFPCIVSKIVFVSFFPSHIRKPTFLLALKDSSFLPPFVPSHEIYEKLIPFLPLALFADNTAVLVVDLRAPFFFTRVFWLA